MFGRMDRARAQGWARCCSSCRPRSSADRERLATLPRDAAEAGATRSSSGTRAGTRPPILDLCATTTPRSASPTTPPRRRPGRSRRASSTSAAHGPSGRYSGSYTDETLRAMGRRHPALDAKGARSSATSTTTSRARRPRTRNAVRACLEPAPIVQAGQAADSGAPARAPGRRGGSSRRGRGSRACASIVRLARPMIRSASSAS